MTTTFAQAVATTPPIGRTENAMPTFTRSGNPLVDLFQAIGSYRDNVARSVRRPGRGQRTAQVREPDEAFAPLIELFRAAVAYDLGATIRMLFWARDVRGGAGVRRVFRILLSDLAQRVLLPDALLELVPEYGRWDDLLVLLDVPSADYHRAVGVILRNALLDDRRKGLVAKWLPREGRHAAILRRMFGMTPKVWRSGLVERTRVVEQQMCARQWDDINFSHVPSVAAARYQRAFGRRARERYTAYKEALKRGDGTAKVNAAALYPYDVLKALREGDEDVATAQWNALPNYLGDARILPMIDTSGSMVSHVVMGSQRAMDIAVALGLYIADKQPGRLANVVLAFSDTAQAVVLSGTLRNKLTTIEKMDWQASTSIEAAFAEVLRIAMERAVPQEEMPAYLLIISDMEFNISRAMPDERAFEMARRMFTAAGYELPKVVFWNVATRPDNVPVKAVAGGAALISGFSPAIMKAVLAQGELDPQEFTPESVMWRTINDARYLPVEEALMARVEPAA